MKNTVDEDTITREVVILAVAALLFARNDDGTEGALMRSFNRAERFVDVAKQRYGSLNDA